MAQGYKNQIFVKGTASYKDFDLTFLSNPNSGDLRTKEDADFIKQAIKILLFTNIGERPFRPNLAGNLGGMLFEQLDRLTVINLRKSIANVLRAYEPRISVIDIVVDDTQANTNTLGVMIKFVILNTQSIEKLPILLHRLR